MFMLGVDHKTVTDMSIGYISYVFLPGFAMPPVHDHPLGCTYPHKKLSYTPSSTHPPSNTVVVPRRIPYRYLLRGLRDSGLLSLKPTSISTSAELMLSR
jgi:hypothetical protein